MMWRNRRSCAGSCGSPSKQGHSPEGGESPNSAPLGDGHQLRYRPEIDGIRALAVLSVLIHHVYPFLLPGGFVPTV